MKDPIERADAIAALDDEITITGTANAFVVKDYVQRVLRKLRDLPSAQPTQTNAESTQDFGRDTNVPSTDCISREAAINAINKAFKHVFEWDGTEPLGRRVLKDVPSAQPRRETGSWTEKHHAYADEEKVIEEWQSCKCSVCGRYDTRPYLYYFNEPNFCSWCGADMREVDA